MTISTMASDKKLWIQQLEALIQKRLKKAEQEAMKAFASDYLHNVPTDDLAGKSVDEVFSRIHSGWRFIQTFESGEDRIPKIEIINPDPDIALKSQHTVVMLLQRGMPFLVDSVRMHLASRQLTIHSVQSLVYQAQRTRAGKLKKRDKCDYDQGCAIDLKDYQTEAFMFFEIDLIAGEKQLKALIDEIQDVLSDVRAVVGDFGDMEGRIQSIINTLKHNPPPLPEEEVNEAIAYLNWLTEGNFTFLGYKEYKVGKKAGRSVIRHVNKTELGLFKLRSESTRDKFVDTLQPDVRNYLTEKRLLTFATSGTLSRVHRPVYPDYIAIRQFDKQGNVVGECGFLGLYTLAVFTEKTRNIPILRNKVDAVMRRSGLYPFTHGGKDLLRVLETFPREELFKTDLDELFKTTTAIAQIKERQQTRLFVRRDHFGKFVSCLVYMPRDIYDSEIRKKIQDILCHTFRALNVEFSTYFGSSALVRTHFVLRTNPEETLEYDVGTLERAIIKVTRSWQDDLVQGLIDEYGDERGTAYAQRYRHAFPLSYRDDFTPSIAVSDVERVESLCEEKPLALWFYQRDGEPANRAHFALYQRNEQLTLSDIIPIFENMGLKTLGEHLYKIIDDDGVVVWKHDFSLQYTSGESLDAKSLRDVFTKAFVRVWHDNASNDAFNKLVLALGLNWREVSYLRACAHYLKQIRLGFSQAYYADTLLRYPAMTMALVHHFNTKFDPQLALSIPERTTQLMELEQAYMKLLDEVQSLSEDRVLRNYLHLNKAMLRTNFFQPGSDGKLKKYFSFKIDPRQLPNIPLPRPMYEVFVYSNRVEGVHLRGGKVARGGLRWSDRVEDYRTEVLGLVKAQQVKNPVIVPVGAKGGFVAQRAQGITDREQYLKEGITCYRIFIRGLLDITDNLKSGEVLPPPEVIRYDGDDPYLVVAADKGTATFSDIANELAGRYDFWLGDAFASGGSQGYDHKGMGITAKGAWVSVQRHFRERGVDIQNTDFTVVGIGGMAGDVFGNGMLLSRHIQLVAAFDHMNVFIDPNPNPEESFKERERLFKIGHVGWDDYNAELISKGGGVFSRAAKSIQITPEMQARFDISETSLTPSELINRVLKAPVDLLWNGGIGTYVKASTETHDDVGDRANDSLRINGCELRAKVAGEGGNLGMTQLGRIEYAQSGGAVNTDAVDNVGGVDCSDHEVNIKILLNEVVTEGKLTEKRRNNLLERMTDEVSALVLRNSYCQTRSLSIAQSLAVSHGDELRRFIVGLEERGRLDRELEFLPPEEELMARLSQGQGLTRPELAVVLAYAKSELKDVLAKSNIADDEYLAKQVVTAFPATLEQQYPSYLHAHRLRREIVATEYANEMVNYMGITYVHRMMEATGATAGQVVQAYTAARQIFGMLPLWKSVEALDYKVPAALQIRMMKRIMRMVRHASRWLLQQRYENVSTQELIQHFAPGVVTLENSLEKFLCGDLAKLWNANQAEFKEAGVPAALAKQVASTDELYFALNMVDVSNRTGHSVEQVAGVFFNLISHLDLHRFRQAVSRIDVVNIWHSKVRDVFRDDVDRQLCILTESVLQFEGAPDKPADKVSYWLEAQSKQLARWQEIQKALRELETGDGDISMYTVAIRELVEFGRSTNTALEN
ncbi:MAG: NAD-glutamate dehydrogenase [Pseudomonadales bacterium]